MAHADSCARDAKSNSPPSVGWTLERVGLLLQCASDGLSASQAAEMLGLTRNAVLGKAYRLRVTFHGDADKGLQRHRQRQAKRQARPGPRPRLFAPGPMDIDPSSPPAGTRTLTQLRCGQCRWPLNDPGPDEMHRTLFCAAPTLAGSFCPPHAAMAFAPPKASVEELIRSLRGVR